MTDPFAAPSADGLADEPADDAKPPAIGMLAGVATSLAALVALTGVLQMLSMLVIGIWWARPTPWLLGALGLAGLAAGAGTFRARLPAVIAAVLIDALATVAWALWTLFALWNGLISPAYALAAAASGLATVLAAIAVGPVARAARARAALYR